ncbi:Ntn hydrolase family protein [Halorussus litoreus]|uniref:proteasome subunit beta n=1 Tax=Halorussus litoreus TaxID=1710536 RepID=UPI000E26A200|nr:proteasome subunit beta [Halorussus litoreus]
MPNPNPQPAHGSPNRGGATLNEEPELTKTGTTTVALAASDGAVVMADRRASAGGRFVTSKDTRKIEQVHPAGAVALSGAVGEIQAYTRRLAAQADQYEVRRGDPPTMHAFATFAGNLLRSGQFRMVRPLLAGVDADGSHVYGMDGAGGVTEVPYDAKGSGTQFALGVLEREYRPDLTVADATPAAARAVESAIERDTASGNGVTVARISTDGVTIDAHDDPAELYEGAPSAEGTDGVNSSEETDGANPSEEVA